MGNNNYKDRFAQFYRVQYVVTAGVAIIAFLLIWIWSEEKQKVDTRRRLFSNCIFSCEFRREKLPGDRPISKECMDSCGKQYGQYK